jgi:quinate/shikimate dehydrogenase (NAD+)
VIVGLVGKGIQKSRTPAMHEAEGWRQGFRYVYELLDVETMGDAPPPLAEIVRSAELCGFRGLNITYPFKREVVDLVDHVSDTARAVGSVNTVVFRDGKRFGHNTDKWAFAESFRQTMADVARRLVLLIGAGGAGAAVAHALFECGVERLAIHDTNRAAAEELAGRLRRHFEAGCAHVIGDPMIASEIDGVVNASPVGMATMPGTAFPPSRLRPQIWVADIVYFPIETKLLRAARERGCRTLSGAGMAVFQAARAFELFTGAPPDRDCMKATFDAVAT